jgi:hypothetical protein
MRTLPSEIDRAVALVNLDDRSAASTAAVLESFGETDVALVADEVVAIGAVLDRLRDVFAAPDRDIAAGLLNALLAENAGPPRLVRHEGWTWHLHVDRADDAPWSEWLASSAALALATRLAASDGVPWGVCAADSCSNAFVHDGRGGERRWCSTTCASRERVRRHRASRSVLQDRPDRAGTEGQDEVSDRRTRPARRARRGASATA